MSVCVYAHVQSECICQAQARTEASKSRQRGGCENVEEKWSLQDGQWTRNTARTRNLLARNVCDWVSCSSIISIFCSRVSRSFALHATEWRNLSSSDHLRWDREVYRQKRREANICARKQKKETKRSGAYRFVDIQFSSRVFISEALGVVENGWAKSCMCV